MENKMTLQAAPAIDERRERVMKILVVVARTLLGLVFVAAGLSGFLILNNPPPAPPGLAGLFQEVFFRSGWVLFVDGAEFITGALLVTNRYVPFALVVSAAILANIYAFHITMAPSGLPAPIVLTMLWLIVAWPLRRHFALLFVKTPQL